MTTPTTTEEEREPDAAETAPPATEPEYGESDRIAITAKQVVYNAISGDINAEGAVFGVGARVRRATGTITLETLRSALRNFVRPRELAQASRILRRHRLVVLHGNDGDGKYTAALKLLSEVCDIEADGRALTSISPATTLAQLGTGMTYRRGRGYLVADLVSDGTAPQVREHDLRALTSALSRAGAYLVVTSTEPDMREQLLPEFATDVTAPDPRELLLHLPGVAELDDSVRQAALEQVVHLRPREVVALAAGLKDDPENAFRAFRSEARQQVSEWVQKTSLRRDIFEVTVVALFGALPESVFDDLVAGLLAVSDPAPPPTTAGSDQELRRRNREHPLLVSTGRERSDGVGRRISFRLREHRALVLEALYDEFGHQLWDPVRRWLIEIGALGLTGRAEGELAAGLATLARHDFADVLTSYLDPWASGGVVERSQAALVLWFMSDDGLGPLALSTVLAWGDRQGTAKALTSAMALGGPLGLRYPAEAMQRLCFLALRSKRIRDAAGGSLAFLLATAAEAGATATGDVLATVARELVTATNRKVLDGVTLPDVAATVADPLADAPETTDGDAFEKGVSVRVIRAARQLVVILLGAYRVDVAEPVAALILREQAENIPLLGVLWADVLCSTPHRGDAISALRATLKALETADDVQASVTALGAAIHEAMPPAHRQLRSDELKRLLPGGSRSAEANTTALLHALGGLKPAVLPRSRRPRGDL
jgi:hypothetical protein